MVAPPPGLPFEVLADLGLTDIVSLLGAPGYDPRPLAGHQVLLQDLHGGQLPDDVAGEQAMVGRAVLAVVELLDAGRSVVVHCRAGIGRTGLVVGAVLVASGHSPDDVEAWLDDVQRARGAAGWPESPWQREVLADISHSRGIEVREP